MKKKRNKNILIFAVLLVVAFGLLGFNRLPLLPSGGSDNSGGQDQNSGSARSYVLNTCTSDALTTFHIHPRLTILINGKNYVVPANIGAGLTCLRPIHTHDDSGTIHVESPTQKDFTLGDFFAIWAQPFSKDQILNYKSDSSHGIVMTVDGQPNSEYGNLILKDKQQIAIEYKITR